MRIINHFHAAIAAFECFMTLPLSSGLRTKNQLSHIMRVASIQKKKNPFLTSLELTTV